MVHDVFPGPVHEAHSPSQGRHKVVMSWMTNCSGLVLPEKVGGDDGYVAAGHPEV